MPVKPKPPAPGVGSVDAHARPRTSSSSTTQEVEALRFTPDPVLHKQAGDSAAASSSAPEINAASATSRVQVHPSSVSTATSVAATDVLVLQDYVIPSAVDLPEADARGIRTYNAREYVDVQDVGTVMLGVDAETGLRRAGLSKERQPSGPVLAHDPASNSWYPLQDFSASTPDSAVAAPRERRRSPRQSEDEYESALEELPGHDDGSEAFYLASESMPIKPFTLEELNLMRSETRYSFLGNRLGSYNRANNGKYPLRDTDGRPIRIRQLQTKVRFKNGDQFTSEQIKPYIKFEGHEDVAMLYEEKLQWRLFTEADVNVPGESALIGQSMVVANRRIAKGEAIGVYGGVITPKRFIRRNEQTFSMLAGMRVRYGPGTLLPDPLAILGDNIISRINSNFDYDDTGKPIRQAAGGYNVEAVPFNVEAQQWIGNKQVTKKFILSAIFASDDIPAGVELRLDYNYTEQEVSWAFA
jgi:hypothetical protein